MIWKALIFRKKTIYSPKADRLVPFQETFFCHMHSNWGILWYLICQKISVFDICRFILYWKLCGREREISQILSTISKRHSPPGSNTHQFRIFDSFLILIPELLFQFLKCTSSLLQFIFVTLLQFSKGNVKGTVSSEVYSTNFIAIPELVECFLS